MIFPLHTYICILEKLIKKKYEKNIFSTNFKMVLKGTLLNYSTSASIYGALGFMKHLMEMGISLCVNAQTFMLIHMYNFDN